MSYSMILDIIFMIEYYESSIISILYTSIFTVRIRVTFSYYLIYR